MDIERMHEMIEKLSESVKCEFDKGIENIDTCEMKEAIDMLKDLSEAMYYRTLTVAMEESSAEETMYMFDRYGDDRRFYNHYHYKNGKFAPKGSGVRRGYDEPPYYHMMPYEMTVADYKSHSPEYYRDLDRTSGRLYFSEPMKEMAGNSDRSVDMRNAESRYDKAKRMYTETKEMHKDNTPESKQTKMKSLESYAKELTEDVMGVVEDMTAEERALLKNKVQVLAQKL